MKILAIDQATVVSGWALFEDDRLIKYGEIKASGKNYVFRMKDIRDGIDKLINEHAPDAIIIEDVQFQSNRKVFCQLSQLQGVIFSLLFDKDLWFYVCPSKTWKSFCGIKGRKRVEQKLNTIAHIKQTFGIDVSEDCADACCIGLWACNGIKGVKD